RFFRLVRSHTPSGFPVDEIPTRRPFEDPGPDPFYYRLAQRDGPKLAKTHMPYALDEARLARFRELFDRPQYEVNALPSYDLKVSANPLRAFGALPIESRYRFMLDEAEFTLMGFIKGPVCRGQVALNVIQERFWITFLDPKTPFSAEETEMLREVDNELELPAESGSNPLPTHWFGMSDKHLDYVDKKAALWTRIAKGSSGINVGAIWDGDGKNSNAALTVFRHFDSASVVRGLVGGPPKTAWVIDYPMLERIHYLLVAGFDVYGNLAHQLMSRLYMDFLRMEGEANLLAFVPPARRKELADAWYRDISSAARERVEHELTRPGPTPRIAYHTAQPELELFDMLEHRLENVRDRTYDLARVQPDAAIERLDRIRGEAASFMPEISFAAISGSDGAVYYFTLLRDSAHSNVAQLFDENDRRLKTEDALGVVPGFLGAYPNALFAVPAADLPGWVDAIEHLNSTDDYRALRQRFGVLRNSPNFWAFSDRIHTAYHDAQPLGSGILDYNRLEAE
ncbi:MAG TPA: fatty acid cis/trans isomerase, partial [Polyangiales bacterium]|nr:fatty acid cis/trans isomerase [Polyangiales bacterium]